MSEPEAKKMRLDEIASNLQIRKTVEDVLKKMKASKNNLKPVLRDALLEDIKTIDFYIGTVKQKRFISQVISELSKALPFTNYTHLKRVRKCQVLLCPADDMSSEDVKAALRRDGIDFESWFDDEIAVVPVASKAPVLKWQNESAHKMWPCNFHPNKYLEKFASGSYFDEERVSKHRTYMHLAYEVGLLHQELHANHTPKDEPNTEDDLSNMILFRIKDENIEGMTVESDDIDDSTKSALKCIKGVVVVDPKIDSVVAVGYDRRHENPCQHQVMIAVDNVAKSQGAGAWDYVDSLGANRIGEKVEHNGLMLSGIPKILLGILKEKYVDVKFGGRPSIPRNRESESEDCDGPYICTGYDVYTSNEPCIMCAMALVHARVSKVFFGMENSTQGGVSSKCKLHDVKDLNHHYDVFTEFFDDDII